MIIILMIVNDRLDGSKPHCIHDEQAMSKLQSQETE